MAEFAEKLERIRKSCGDGLAIEAKINPDEADNAGEADMNEVSTTFKA